jgi:nitrogen regulatory protein PII
MRLIVILVEQASVEGLSAALPRSGVTSVTIEEVNRGTKVVPEHGSRHLRVELLVEDHAVDYVMAGLSFAVSVGLMGECKRAWITPVQERPVNA